MGPIFLCLFRIIHLVSVPPAAGKTTYPVFRELDGRIEAHVFISFLAHGLHVTLEQHNKKAATGLSYRSVLARLSRIQMPDVTIPATDGRELPINDGNANRLTRFPSQARRPR